MKTDWEKQAQRRILRNQIVIMRALHSLVVQAPKFRDSHVVNDLEIAIHTSDQFFQGD